MCGDIRKQDQRVVALRTYEARATASHETMACTRAYRLTADVTSNAAYGAVEPSSTQILRPDSYGRKRTHMESDTFVERRGIATVWPYIGLPFDRIESTPQLTAAPLRRYGPADNKSRPGHIPEPAARMRPATSLQYAVFGCCASECVTSPATRMRGVRVGRGDVAKSEDCMAGLVGGC